MNLRVPWNLGSVTSSKMSGQSFGCSESTDIITCNTKSPVIAALIVQHLGFYGILFLHFFAVWLFPSQRCTCAVAQWFMLLMTNLSADILNCWSFICYMSTCIWQNAKDKFLVEVISKTVKIPAFCQQIAFMGFVMIFKTSSDYFPKQQNWPNFATGIQCFLWRSNWILKCYLDDVQASKGQSSIRSTCPVTPILTLPAAITIPIFIPAT
jgi:hypothetical protein